MNIDQACAVLDALAAGFPKASLTDAQTESWTDAIQDSGADFDRAHETARRWARTHEWFPSLADFLAVVAPRREVEPVDPDQVLPSPAAARKMSALWRDALADVDKRRANLGPTRGVEGHWHGTPGQPCPMCGGSKAFR